MLSFFRKNWPDAVIELSAPPAVGCNPMVAPVGSGAYTVAAGPVTLRELVAVTLKVYVMLSARFDATNVVVAELVCCLIPPGLTVTV